MSTRHATAPAAGLALALLLVAAPAARAALAEQCAWPPPGGPLIHPESVQVEMAPIVADLDGDGSVEIVVVSFANGDDDGPGHDGILRILRGSDCAEIASVVDIGCVTCFGDAGCRSLDEVDEAGFLCPGCGVAVGDLDDDGTLEIVAVGEGDGSFVESRRLVIFDHAGGFERCTAPTTERVGPVSAPAIADLDADGTPDLVARTSAWSSDGPLLWAVEPTGLGAATAADLDGDGLMEVLTGEAAYRADGSVLWNRDDIRIGTPAVADMDLDCVPEVIVSSRNTASVHVVNGLTGVTRASIPIPVGDCPPRSDGFGGPPTLLDVNGDCVPEIGVAGCRRYALFEWQAGPPEQLVLLWELPIDDGSSRFTGSTMFDLEGDGSVEVLTNDHDWLRIVDAATGAVEQQFASSTFTLLELPVVADVDADGRAEIVVSANDYQHGVHAGVRVLHDPAVPWAAAPPFFNQHSFHVTNALPDGRIPAVEEPSWTRWNSFRVHGSPIRPAAGPTLLGVPPDQAADCDAIPAAATVFAAGGCGFEPEVALAETAAGGPCGELRRTWSATDTCGRTSSATQVIDLDDDEPPALSGMPPDRTLSCHVTPDDVPPTAVDACDPDPSLAFEDEEEPGPCIGSHVLRRTWTARDSCGNEATATQVITLIDDAAPRLVGVPPDLVLPCDAALPPANPTAIDLCDPDPVLELLEVVTPGACTGERIVTRTWTARDDCGNFVSDSQVITFEDDAPPVFSAVPADETLSCHVAPVSNDPVALDACDPDPVVTLLEATTPGPCIGSSTLRRTWMARDDCGNESSVTQVITLVDDAAPRLIGVPRDAVATCDAVPPPGDPRAIDLCDPDPTLAFTERRIDGGCPDEWRLERTWTATDDCGNDVSATQIVVVEDDGPPLISDVPPDVPLECGEPIPPANVTVSDRCDPAPVVTLVEFVVPGSCPGEMDIVREWTAEDRCGGVAIARQVVRVRDTTPPSIAGGETFCLWSPNHWMACFGPEDLHPTVIDACGGETSWRLVACVSSQPEDDLGDGAFSPDCVIEADGRACVRSERQGMRPEGRTYGLLGIAVDACGNESEPALVGEIHVPRDQREHDDCLKIQDVGAKGPGRP